MRVENTTRQADPQLSHRPVSCGWCHTEASSGWVAKVNRWTLMFPDDPLRDDWLCPDCGPAHESMSRLMSMLCNAFAIKFGWLPKVLMADYGRPTHRVTIDTATSPDERLHYVPDAESMRVLRAFKDVTALEPETIAIVRDGRRFKYVEQSPSA